MSADDKPKEVPPGGSYQVTRFNAVRHGVLSKHTVLPWEDSKEYEELLDALVAEYTPHGPTEEHLVEEIAGTIWRKGRVRMGERAAHFRALQQTTDSDHFPSTSKAALVLVTSEFEGRVKGEAISATEEQTAVALRMLEEGEARAAKAMEILTTQAKTAYQSAIMTLSEDEREEFLSKIPLLPDPFDQTTRASPENLKNFIETRLLPRCRDRRYELEHRPLIREQSLRSGVRRRYAKGLRRYSSTGICHPTKSPASGSQTRLLEMRSNVSSVPGRSLQQKTISVRFRQLKAPPAQTSGWKQKRHHGP